ncbi:ABC transporter substrate-binding protein [Paenibacillus sp. FA6]|uniref:ABC transporter substrate-binding protein n=1 Tax=Paenibacillus sp. FA6 TaxID=3413029 RepID=UPI003F658D91
MFRSSKLVVASIVVAMLMLSGCGANNSGNAVVKTNQGEVVNNVSNEQESVNYEEQSNQPRVIQHALGDTEIVGTPIRVVTLYQGANDTAVALGVKPIGVVESWDQQPIYEYLRADLEGVTMLGSELQPNLEQIAKLKPDLIIGSKFRHEKIYPQLSKIAPTVMDETVYEWKDTLSLMADTLNKTETEKELLAKWDERVMDFKTKIDGKMPAKVAITNFRSDHMRVYYNSYSGSILNELGFKNLERPVGSEGEEWGEKITSKERILDLNVNAIFNFNASKDSEMAENNYKEWTSHPLWQELDAVKDNKVYQVDEVYWSTGAGYKSANLMLDSLYDLFELK